MWKNREIEKPKFSGIYNVFGVINKNTEYEVRSRFFAFYSKEYNMFTDSDGEDLTYINEGVEFWFDFNGIKNPEHE